MAIKPTNSNKYRVDVRDITGKRIRRTFSKRSDAIAFEAKVTNSKYNAGLVKNKLKSPSYSIYKALDEFELTKSDLRPTSIKKYGFVFSQLRLFFEAFDIDSIDDFTPSHASLLYKELVKEKLDPKGSTNRMVKAKPKTINFFLNTVRAFFRREVDKGTIKANPMNHIKNLRVEKKKPDYYTIGELTAFFQQEMHQTYRNAFWGLLFTGMRFAELANITWDDIDFPNRLIHVRSKDDFRTKTYNSERSIPMNNDLLKLLRFIWKNKVSDIYPFCSSRGKILRERRLLDICKEVAKDAGIKSRAYLHKFRHTYASMLIQKGVSIQVIKELLGHSSVTQTEIYAHNRTDLLHPEVSKLDNLLPE